MAWKGDGVVSVELRSESNIPELIATARYSFATAPLAAG